MRTDPEFTTFDECHPRIWPEKLGYGLVGDFALHLFEYGSEQIVLALEVVVEGALRDTGPDDHFVGRGVRVSLLAEQLTG